MEVVSNDDTVAPAKLSPEYSTSFIEDFSFDLSCFGREATVSSWVGGISCYYDLDL